MLNLTQQCKGNLKLAGLSEVEKHAYADFRTKYSTRNVKETANIPYFTSDQLQANMFKNVTNLRS